MSTIYIRDYPVANGAKDYMVVVKPHPGGSVNRFEIDTLDQAQAYAEELKGLHGFPVVDETG